MPRVRFLNLGLLFSSFLLDVMRQLSQTQDPGLNTKPGAPASRANMFLKYCHLRATRLDNKRNEVNPQKMKELEKKYEKPQPTDPPLVKGPNGVRHQGGPN